MSLGSGRVHKPNRFSRVDVFCTSVYAIWYQKDYSVCGSHALVEEMIIMLRRS
jgi:hypothetical protein